MTPLHPSGSLVRDYATGQMPLAPALAISAHLERCPACRDRVSTVEGGEGAWLTGSSPALMEPGSFAHAMGRLDAGDPRKPPPGAPMGVRGGVRLPLATARAGLGRRRWLAPGLWAAPVRTHRTDGWRAFVLRAPASTVIPKHGHAGAELIAVLAGAFVDGDRVQAGDFHEPRQGRPHRLEVTADAPCACLIAVQGPVKWRGWARLITPLLGI